jgi:hypothetical protein
MHTQLADEIFFIGLFFIAYFLMATITLKLWIKIRNKKYKIGLIENELGLNVCIGLVFFFWFIPILYLIPQNIVLSETE